MRSHIILVLKFVGIVLAFLVQIILCLGLFVTYVAREEVVPAIKRKISSRFSGGTADAEPYPD